VTTIEDGRYEAGLDLLASRVPDAADRIRTLVPDEPDLSRYAVSFIYGELCQRPQLSMRDRSLVTLAVLAAIGAAEDILTQHVVLARAVGLTGAEIMEAFLHTAAYAGFPRAVTATRVASGVLAAPNGAQAPPTGS